MKFFAIALTATALLGGCVAVPYDQGRPPPQQRAHGDRDRDRDGVPNRADRDRDGDGMPNRYDRAPDNPNRN